MFAVTSSSNPLSEGRFKRQYPIIIVVVNYSMIYQDDGDDPSDFGWCKSSNTARVIVGVEA